MENVRPPTRIRPRSALVAAAALAFAALLSGPRTEARAQDCEVVVRALNSRLSPGIDEKELVSVLRSLNRGRDGRLPGKFVTKRQARRAGWRPGRDLWKVPGMAGKSIGGDRFGNREGMLPRERTWREADLGYRGGRRGGQRIVYSSGGRRMVTVDHYSSFVEVPACR